MPLIQGHCDKSYLPVKELFSSNFLSGDDENAQLCVYVGNEKVIDLVGCRDEQNKSAYGPQSLQVSPGHINILLCFLMPFLLKS